MHVHARGSGLMVVEQPAVPRAIAEQLRRLDPRLKLQPVIDQRHQMVLWQVRFAQPDGRSVWIFNWREVIGDEMSRPRPLSSAILDEAAAWSLNSRRPVIDPLAENDRLREQAEREEIEEALAMADEARKRHGRLPVLHASRSLYLARCRARARGEKV